MGDTLGNKIDSKIKKEEIIHRIDKKKEKEKKIVRTMISIYCKGHGHVSINCPECLDLIQYVEDRIDKCPFLESKTYCSNCKVHCYRPVMRKKIKEVMRYSGPRMILFHPIMVLDHGYQLIKSKLGDKNNSN